MSSKALEVNNINMNRTLWYRKKSHWIRICIFVVFISLLVVAIVNYNKIISIFLQFINWMEKNAITGSLLFVIIFIISNILLIPGSILTMGAGFVYTHIFGLINGIIFSSFLVWIAACFGATFSFLNGRYLLRSIVEYYTQKSPKFRIIEQIVENNGFKVVMLLRLSPLIPYNIFNIFMGITSIRLKDFVLAHFAMIPETIVCCFIGGTIAHIYQLTKGNVKGKILLLILTIIGSIVAFCGIIYISRIAKKEFDKLTQQLPNIHATEIQLLVENENDKQISTVINTELLQGA
eukprot:406109_1